MTGIRLPSFDDAIRQHTRSVDRRSWYLLGGLAALYLLVGVAVASRSSVLVVDEAVRSLSPSRHLGAARALLLDYVVLGQRAPSTWATLPWFVWMSWHRRSLRPLVLLGLELVALNALVGATKLTIGRVSPLHTTSPYRVFAGGDIYPSGHVANCIVLYGLIALLVSGRRATRICSAVAGFIAVSVGVAGILLDMHWPTDILGGWLAGGVVLTATCMLDRAVPPGLTGRSLRRLWLGLAPSRRRT